MSSGWTPPGPYLGSDPEPATSEALPAPAWPAYPAPAPRPVPDRKRAIVALVLSLVPCGLLSVVALVQAIKVLLRPDDGRRHGTGLAVAAVCIASTMILLNVVGIVVDVTGFDDEPERRASGPAAPRQPGDRGDVAIGNLLVGDCLRDTFGGGHATMIRVVPCQEQHHGEVYATFDLAPGAWPGADAAHRLATRGCLQRAEPAAQRTRGVRLYYFYPPSDLVYEVDPTVTCVLQGRRAASGDLLARAAA